MAWLGRRTRGVIAAGLLAATAVVGAWVLGGSGRGAVVAPRGAGADVRDERALGDLVVEPPPDPEDAGRISVSHDAPPPAPRSATPPTTSAPASGELLRGRVLDAATREPVGFLELRYGSSLFEVDPDGRFRSDKKIPSADVDLDFRDPLHGTHVRTLKVAQLEPDATEGRLAPIRIGPTIGVAAANAELGDGTWQARLVELARDGAQHAGAWAPLRAGEPAWFRYDNPWKPHLEGSRFRVDVRSESEGRAGSSDVVAGPAVGRGLGTVHVAVDRALARIVGRVVDPAGAPLEEEAVLLVPLVAPGADVLPEPASTRTSGDGRFERLGVPTGAYLLRLNGEPGLLRRVDVPPAIGGTIDLGDLVVTPPPGGARIEGRLESRAGRELEGAQIVRVRALDGSLDRYEATQRFQVLWFVQPEDDRRVHGTHPISVDVPPGRYELSVVPQDGFAWSPRSAIVDAPATDVVFVREDDVPVPGWRIDALDPADGSPLSEIDVQIQLGGAFQDQAERVESGVVLDLPDADFECLVSAPGRRAKRLLPRDFASGDPRVASVALERGFSARLRVRALDGPIEPSSGVARVRVLASRGLDGARVLADGRKVATSSAGEAWIELDAEPRRIDVELDGWRVVEDERFRGGRLASERDVVVWMVRE